MYVGIRNHEEFLAAQGENLFDLSIWVDASERVDCEMRTSNTIEPYMCDITLDNNGSLPVLVTKVKRLCKVLHGSF